ncbi:MAG: hypothetical protein M1825_003043 [Sarcosagium campestre]|nr:MAG: hypothetical protein M1825_003043 [Sarcosagium campestre]
MSAAATPISSGAFATAIHDLPLDRLHGVAAETQNSMRHLVRSNDQLEPFAAQGDQDCRDAIRENQEVIARMEERLRLLRVEVESRGMRWGDAEVEGKPDPGATETDSSVDGVQAGASSVARVNGAHSGQGLDDEELRRRLDERMANGDGDSDDGVHL